VRVLLVNAAQQAWRNTLNAFMEQLMDKLEHIF
jgi:hypothetical protein